MKKYLLTGIIAFVLILSVVQYFQIRSLKDNIGSGTGSLDMGGWTENEKMMYEHHGTIPTRFQGAAAAQSSNNQMVGGC
jgi:hypothetical protein